MRKTKAASPNKPGKSAKQKQTPRVGLPHIPKLYGLKPRKEYLPWEHAEKRLTASRNYWICTSRPDGRPHSIPVWGFWLDGAFYFGTGRSSRKGQNLANNQAVSVHLESGDDVVIVEGVAKEVTEKQEFDKVDQASRRKYKMPLMVIPDETVLYRVEPKIVLAWLEKEFPTTATRWEF